MSKYNDEGRRRALKALARLCKKLRPEGSDIPVGFDGFDAAAVRDQMERDDSKYFKVPPRTEIPSDIRMNYIVVHDGRDSGERTVSNWLDSYVETGLVQRMGMYLGSPAGGYEIGFYRTNLKKNLNRINEETRPILEKGEKLFTPKR